jgi:hypothetical protein
MGRRRGGRMAIAIAIAIGAGQACTPFRMSTDAGSTDSGQAEVLGSPDSALADGGANCRRDEECASGHCTDGVCCDRACGGQCESCNETGAAGHCLTVSGIPRGARAPCGGTAPCGGRCDGNNTGACTFPGDSVQCAPASCTDGMLTSPSVCNGAGACTTPTKAACATGQCADASMCSCKSSPASCTTSTECCSNQCSSPDGGYCVQN